MTRTEFIKVLQRTEELYKKCWDILATIKIKPDKSLQQFQPLLCEALFDLSVAYRATTSERKKLISRKHLLVPSWFSRRQKALASRQETIMEVSAIGRTLGDSFAWLFYCHDLHLLEQHLKHDANLHMPPGFGGIGEKEFVKQVRNIGNYLVIYHGTTNLLRLGDVSLIDPETFKVVGIGELKTSPMKPGVLSISLLVTGEKKFISSLPVTKDQVATTPATDNLPQAMKDRLNRQLKRNMKALSSKSQKDGSNIKMSIETFIPEFEKVLDKAQAGKFSYVRFGPGLLCIVWKNKNDKLISLFTKNKKVDLDSKFRNLTEHALELLLENSDNNALHVSSLIYKPDGTSRFMLGTLPVFWWPLNIELIRNLIFHQIMVFTAYNPAHLMLKLEEIGLKVEHTEDGGFSLNHEREGKLFSLTGIEYFMDLVSSHLYKEEEVIGMISKSLEAIEDANLQPNTKCVFKFDQRPSIF